MDAVLNVEGHFKYEEKNIDIARFANLVDFLKRKSEGYRPKKSQIFTKIQIDKFLKEADDDKYLLMKVALIVGVFGACRKDELIKMCLADIEDLGACIRILVPDTKMKTAREFIITEGNVEGMNMLEIFRKYFRLRPQTTKHVRFFLGYRSVKCISQPVGVNTGEFSEKDREISWFTEFSKIYWTLLQKMFCFVIS